jgi:SAM-dependent methyltransferase
MKQRKINSQTGSPLRELISHAAANLSSSSPAPGQHKHHSALLFIASFLALYFELVVIRYLSTEIRVFAYLKNLPLIASFLGIGLGMILARPPAMLRRLFPGMTAALFLAIIFAAPLHLTRLWLPSVDYFVWGTILTHGLPATVLILRYLFVVFGMLILVVGFFAVLGCFVGEHLTGLPPLRGYGINLAGSLAGIIAFTLLSSLRQPPVIWLLLGFILLVPFFWGEPVPSGVFALIVLFAVLQPAHTFWSPYYRVNLTELDPPSGWPRPSAYFLSVNHDYHQKPIDLSPDFVARYPLAEPNHSARSTYELPYQLVKNPRQVLIVGAGTGNDVAAALRHGATQVDAVEIDPVILQIGKKYHPEHPYDSPFVTVHVDDARAFFKKAKSKYDLIVFGYLDSHTLLTAFSSLRLDNYVYTLESLREAKRLLRKGGSVCMSFGSGRTFVSDRMFATLSRAFGVPPRVYFTGYDTAGVVFVEGPARESNPPGDVEEITRDLQSGQRGAVVATDHWPFLYLRGREIPQSILWVVLLFLGGSVLLLHRTITLPSLASVPHTHLFLLGAGFLLLETKEVTELALLFGSTWIVNAVVIGAFLTMALLANLLVIYRPISRGAAYAGLFASLAISTIFPYSVLDVLSPALKVIVAAIIVGLPVLFSGIVFSLSFRDVAEPPKGLGMNLLGAVVGGVLENSVMVAGTPILGVLAALLYGGSLLFAPKNMHQRALVSPVQAQESNSLG